MDWLICWNSLSMDFFLLDQMLIVRCHRNEFSLIYFRLEIINNNNNNLSFRKITWDNNFENHFFFKILNWRKKMEWNLIVFFRLILCPNTHTKTHFLNAILQFLCCCCCCIPKKIEDENSSILNTFVILSFPFGVCVCFCFDDYRQTKNMWVISNTNNILRRKHFFEGKKVLNEKVDSSMNSFCLAFFNQSILPSITIFYEIYSLPWRERAVLFNFYSIR